MGSHFVGAKDKLMDATGWLILLGAVFLVALEIYGIVRRHPLALWIAEVLVMGAVLALVKALFGTRGHIRAYAGRPRLRR
jgi:hypothetical protein